MTAPPAPGGTIEPAAPTIGRVRGERVWLRGFERADLEAYRAGTNSLESGRWAGYRAPLSTFNVEQWFEDRVVARHGKGEYYFVISPIGTTEFLGTLWLWGMDSRLGGLELSIFLAESAGLGRGIGTDAINAALDFAFGSTATERVWLFTLEHNRRAQRAFEKAGFRRDGVIRHIDRVEGEWADAVLMSVLRNEWMALERPRSWNRPAPDGV